MKKFFYGVAVLRRRINDQMHNLVMSGLFANKKVALQKIKEQAIADFSPTLGWELVDIVAHAIDKKQAAAIIKEYSPLVDADGRAAAMDSLKLERDKLRVFKDYVHKRLDDAGVEKDPESAHKANGCRIGGRLDIVLGWKPEAPA